MSEKVTFLMKITKQPKCIDRQNDLWVFYCPFDKKWCKGTRHGYTSEFWSQMYFECKNNHRIEAPGWWK
ncbi:MAG: hypothetical protein RXO36_05840 [Candidatus Nanopusillus acidilobi]